jgi:hypothetical protein
VVRTDVIALELGTEIRFPLDVGGEGRKLCDTINCFVYRGKYEGRNESIQTLR